jgi:hypothetical protein
LFNCDPLRNSTYESAIPFEALGHLPPDLFRRAAHDGVQEVLVGDAETGQEMMTRKSTQ